MATVRDKCHYHNKYATIVAEWQKRTLNQAKVPMKWVNEREREDRTEEKIVEHWIKE